MPSPALTADERERRLVEYLLTLHKGQLGEFRLSRLNRIANFRRALMDLLNEMIECRAEELAAGMIEQYAPQRPIPAWKTEEVVKGRLPLPEKTGPPGRRLVEPGDRKRRKPKWLATETGRIKRGARGV